MEEEYVMNEQYVQIEGYLDLIKAQGVCAITGLPLAEDTELHMILLKTPADWPFPVWGDFSLGRYAKAIAFVSSAALSPSGLPVGTMTKAVEILNGTIIYHDVNETIYHGVRTIDTPVAEETAVYHEERHNCNSVRRKTGA